MNKFLVTTLFITLYIPEVLRGALIDNQAGYNIIDNYEYEEYADLNIKKLKNLLSMKKELIFEKELPKKLLVKCHANKGIYGGIGRNYLLY